MSGEVYGDRIPPLAMILMKSARALITSRVFLKTPSIPSQVPAGKPGYAISISNPEFK